MATKKNDPLAVSMLVELPDDMSEEQAKLLAAALKRTVVDFSRALSGGGGELKIGSVHGPAAPAALVEIRGHDSVPGVFLKHRRRA
jgi:hypothetical protein